MPRQGSECTRCVMTHCIGHWMCDARRYMRRSPILKYSKYILIALIVVIAAFMPLGNSEKKCGLFACRDKAERGCLCSCYGTVASRICDLLNAFLCLMKAFLDIFMNVGRRVSGKPVQGQGDGAAAGAGAGPAGKAGAAGAAGGAGGAAAGGDKDKAGAKGKKTTESVASSPIPRVETKESKQQTATPPAAGTPPVKKEDTKKEDVTKAKSDSAASLKKEPPKADTVKKDPSKQDLTETKGAKSPSAGPGGNKPKKSPSKGSSIPKKSDDLPTSKSKRVSEELYRTDKTPSSFSCEDSGIMIEISNASLAERLCRVVDLTGPPTPERKPLRFAKFETKMYNSESSKREPVPSSQRPKEDVNVIKYDGGGGAVPGPPEGRPTAPGGYEGRPTATAGPTRARDPHCRARCLGCKLGKLPTVSELYKIPEKSDDKCTVCSSKCLGKRIGAFVSKFDDEGNRIENPKKIKSCPLKDTIFSLDLLRSLYTSFARTSKKIQELNEYDGTDATEVTNEEQSQESPAPREPCHCGRRRVASSRDGFLGISFDEDFCVKACDCDGGVSYEVHEIIEPKKKTFNERLSEFLEFEPKNPKTKPEVSVASLQKAEKKDQQKEKEMEAERERLLKEMQEKEKKYF